MEKAKSIDTVRERTTFYKRQKRYNINSTYNNNNFIINISNCNNKCSK